MAWLVELFSPTHPDVRVAQSVLVLAIVAFLGLALGTIKIKGIGLGIAGVLFSGLLVGHLYGQYGPKDTPPIDHSILEFAREFGLILFVYTIGMQVGPGFFASLRRQGLPLNLMAGSIVVLGAVIAVGIWAVGMGRDRNMLPAAVGLFSGATTNTPSLAASRQALKDVYRADAVDMGHAPAKGPAPATGTAPASTASTTSTTVPTTALTSDGHAASGAAHATGSHGGAADAIDPRLNLPGMAYAVAYPFGIIGIIVVMLFIRRFFKVDLAAETEMISRLNAAGRTKLETMNLEVKNTNLHGKRISEIPTLTQGGVVISRVLRAGRPEVASADSVLQAGDVLLAVGPRKGLEDLRMIVGSESKVDVRQVPSEIISKRILVTHKQVIGQTLDELDLRARFGVNVTRMHRNEIEIPVTPDLKLQFADNLVVVGDAPSIKAAAAELGDSPKQLNHPAVIPIFVGIALGVILGRWPIDVGMSAPVRLGLAGGPLLVAIILSRLGNIGPLIWYMPISANFMLREVGIVLFLACVGLGGGGKFVETLTTNGVQWMLYGALITLIPLLVVGLIGRIWFKVNYLSLCGLLAGSMTDPPALAFAGAVTGSDAPSVSYATVYPLTMLLRVICAQAIVLLFA